MRPLLLLLLLPSSLAGIVVEQGIQLSATAGDGPLTLAAGDVGEASFGSSGNNATVAVVLNGTPGTILQLNGAWRVHAVLVSSSHQDIAVDLNATRQITISNGTTDASSGAAVSAPAALRVSGGGAGTTELDVVAVPADGGPDVRYRIAVTS